MRFFSHKFGFIGRAVGRHYKSLEQKILRASSAVVTISNDFVPSLIKEFGVPIKNIHVIENWAPLDGIKPQPKDNPWARANNLAKSKVVLYSGTLGIKHDPKQILALASALRDEPRTEFIVVSEGPVANWLNQQAIALGLSSFRVLPFQPFEVYEQVLGSADILLSVLEDDASAFSVPSKVLSYLCARRPILLSATEENLAARIIQAAGAGLVSPAGDHQQLIENARILLGSPELRLSAAHEGYLYATRNFNIEVICDHFFSVLLEAASLHPKPQEMGRSHRAATSSQVVLVDNPRLPSESEH